MIEKSCRVRNEQGETFIVSEIFEGMAHLIPDHEPQTTLSAPLTSLQRVSGPAKLHPLLPLN
jgi:hypothetical protein